MNAWDIDPDLYDSLWRLLREWYLRRREAQSHASAKTAPEPGRHAGCRA